MIKNTGIQLQAGFDIKKKVQPQKEAQESLTQEGWGGKKVLIQLICQPVCVFLATAHPLILWPSL